MAAVIAFINPPLLERKTMITPIKKADILQAARIDTE
jgi:hypothetical protein